MKAIMDNISIVLVGMRNGGNIGSAARAMKNMGVSNLILVNPVPYDSPEVYNLAWGAEEIVRNARVCRTLNEALRDFGLVVGTTRRKGRYRRPIIELREAVPRIASVTKTNRVAILFGREDKGLSNEELALCQVAMRIPTSPRGAPSLNVAQAVMVVCHEFFQYADSDHSETPVSLASQSELWQLFTRLESALKSIGYGDKGNRKVLTSVMRTLKRILGRSGLVDDELRAMHGICQQIERYVKTAVSCKH
ncbi:MAG: RNA methyltransferase [Candidatus Aureabacteria bacterium]|nr:RNA methyltransferase [Candidatus Auribacterota bacterium]